MKILVTGAGGGLGQELRSVLAGDDLVWLDRAALDITDADAVEAAVTAAQPAAIIHAAAYTAVDQAEDEPGQALLVNQAGTANVAKAAAAVGAALVYPSTDYVFDGEKGTPYLEDDLTAPLSVYGESKRQGELAALEYNPRTFVVRTSWLYSHHGKSFVGTMRQLLAPHPAGGEGLAERAELSVVADEISAPTYARPFAALLRDLLRTKAYGLYHASCAGETSWHGLATAIAERVGSQTTLQPITAAAWGAKAKRPRYSVLGGGKIGGLGLKLPDWEESLAQYFADA